MCFFYVCVIIFEDKNKKEVKKMTDWKMVTVSMIVLAIVIEVCLCIYEVVQVITSMNSVKQKLMETITHIIITSTVIFITYIVGQRSILYFMN